MPTSAQRYSTLSIAMHWLMALLMIAVYATIELREIYPKGSDPREMLKTWHFMLGLLVLGLVAVRIGARVSRPTPPIVPAPSPMKQKMAAIGHGLLYLLMIAMPLAGWLILSAAGKPIPFFGMELPALIGENKALAGTIKKVHETVGTLGYLLIAVHAFAALLHHYMLRDNTLLRMLQRHGKRDEQG